MVQTPVRIGMPQFHTIKRYLFDLDLNLPVALNDPFLDLLCRVKRIGIS